MRRITFATIIAMLFAGLTATSAHAVTNFDNAPSGAHYAKGYGEPVCTYALGTVTCTETRIEGVGHTNAEVVLDVTSSFTGVCHNPGVNNKVVDPFTESVTASTSSDLVSSRNGRLIVPAQETEALSVEEFEDAFECPNPNWEADVTDSSISWEYTLTFDDFQFPAITVIGSA